MWELIDGMYVNKEDGTVMDANSFQDMMQKQEGQTPADPAASQTDPTNSNVLTGAILPKQAPQTEVKPIKPIGGKVLGIVGGLVGGYFGGPAGAAVLSKVGEKLGGGGGTEAVTKINAPELGTAYITSLVGGALSDGLDMSTPELSDSASLYSNAAASKVAESPIYDQLSNSYVSAGAKGLGDVASSPAATTFGPRLDWSQAIPLDKFIEPNLNSLPQSNLGSNLDFYNSAPKSPTFADNVSAIYNYGKGQVKGQTSGLIGGDYLPSKQSESMVANFGEGLFGGPKTTADVGKYGQAGQLDTIVANAKEGNVASSLGGMAKYTMENYKPPVKRRRYY